MKGLIVTSSIAFALAALCSVPCAADDSDDGVDYSFPCHKTLLGDENWSCVQNNKARADCLSLPAEKRPPGNPRCLTYYHLDRIEKEKREAADRRDFNGEDGSGKSRWFDPATGAIHYKQDRAAAVSKYSFAYADKKGDGSALKLSLGMSGRVGSKGGVEGPTILNSRIPARYWDLNYRAFADFDGNIAGYGDKAAIFKGTSGKAAARRLWGAKYMPNMVAGIQVGANWQYDRTPVIPNSATGEMLFVFGIEDPLRESLSFGIGAEGGKPVWDKNGVGLKLAAAYQRDFDGIGYGVGVEHNEDFQNAYSVTKGLAKVEKRLKFFGSPFTIGALISAQATKDRVAGADNRTKETINSIETGIYLGKTIR